MNMTIKMQVTQIVTYTTFKNRESETHTYLMYGTPNKSTIRKTINDLFANEETKKINVVDIVKHNLFVDVCDDDLEKTLKQIASDYAKTKFNFECAIV